MGKWTQGHSGAGTLIRRGRIHRWDTDGLRPNRRSNGTTITFSLTFELDESIGAGHLVELNDGDLN